MRVLKGVIIKGIASTFPGWKQDFDIVFFFGYKLGGKLKDFRGSAPAVIENNKERPSLFELRVFDVLEHKGKLFLSNEFNEPCIKESPIFFPGYSWHFFASPFPFSENNSFR